MPYFFSKIRKEVKKIVIFCSLIGVLRVKMLFIFLYLIETEIILFKYCLSYFLQSLTKADFSRGFCMFDILFFLSCELKEL